MKESAPTARLLRERRTDRPFPRIVPERRRYRRLKVSLQGRLMSEDEREYPFEVIDMSAGGMALLAPVSCQVGERIVAYIDNLGRLEGTVARAFEGGFAVQINASVQKRERIVNLLTWYANSELVADERQYERYAPRVVSQKLILPNGEVHNCQVIDISQSGASIAAAVKPLIQSLVVLGRLRGRVVRHHDQGLAIEFAELQDPDSLARTFG